MKIVGSNTRDALAGVFTTRRFNHQQHVALSLTPDNPEESSKLGLDKPPVEGKLSALVSNRFRDVGFGFCCGQFQGGRVLSLAPHWVNVISARGSLRIWVGGCRWHCSFASFRGRLAAPSAHGKKDDGGEQTQQRDGRQATNQGRRMAAEPGDFIP